MKPWNTYRNGRLIIVIDEEAAANNAIGMERYPAEPGSANYRGPAPVDKVDKMLENTGFVDSVDDLSTETAEKPAAVDRKAYQREWLRKKRLERKK